MKKYDLIVVGGGIAGVSAAVSAAREGMTVLLLEKFGSLGGAMSNSLVYPFMSYRVKGENRWLTSAGIFTEIRERKEKYNDASWETYKNVFDDMVTEAGVEVLFHVTAFEAVTEERQIKSLKVATKFPHIARRYYESKGRDISIIKLNGSIEIAPILGLSDVIVDIVETGTTLRENDLSVMEEIVPISARLIANKSGYKFKSAQIDAVVRGIGAQVEEV